jgi:hypothetical protein
MATYQPLRSLRFINALASTGAGNVLRRMLKDRP